MKSHVVTEMLAPTSIGPERDAEQINGEPSRKRAPDADAPERVDLALDRGDHKGRGDENEDDRYAGQRGRLFGELAHVLMDDLVCAAGQRELQQKRLERVEPLLEHRKPRGDRERNGGERHDSQQGGEGEAARGAAKAGVARARRDAAHERGESKDRRQQVHHLVGVADPRIGRLSHAPFRPPETPPFDVSFELAPTTNEPTSPPATMSHCHGACHERLASLACLVPHS